MRSRLSFVGVLLLALVACGPDRSEPAPLEGQQADRVDATQQQSQDARDLSIADAERIGFEPEDQQIYQMIGATDGWDGQLEGVTVEIYSFADSIPEQLFRNATRTGNVSGWIGYCRVHNLVMLYKGEGACEALRQLQNGRQ